MEAEQFQIILVPHHRRENNLIQEKQTAITPNGRTLKKAIVFLDLLTIEAHPAGALIAEVLHREAIIVHQLLKEAAAVQPENNNLLILN